MNNKLTPELQSQIEEMQALAEKYSRNGYRTVVVNEDLVKAIKSANNYSKIAFRSTKEHKAIEFTLGMLVSAMSDQIQGEWR